MKSRGHWESISPLGSRGGFRRFVAGIAVATSLACSDSDTLSLEGPAPLWDLPECNFEQEYLADGGIGIDGIPAISEPNFSDTRFPDDFAYLQDNHRVIGIVLDGQAMAFPLSALWHHEVVNLNSGSVQLVVTHGTLAGTSRVFHRSAVAGSEFGVSGLLYRNDVLLYDRTTAPTLWVQLNGEGRCGPRSGQGLSPYPFVETTWRGWLSLHPETRVLVPSPLVAAPWGLYPYGSYESSSEFFFTDAMPPPDPRLPPKGRVLGIPDGSQSGIAFHFGALSETGPVAVANAEAGGRALAVFWRSDLQGAAAYWAEAEEQTLTFAVQDEQILDQETGTTWSFLGSGTDGDLAGAQLEPIPEATVAYWGAWAAFYPDSEIWEGG